jgi:hypothetical protein
VISDEKVTRVWFIRGDLEQILVQVASPGNRGNGVVGTLHYIIQLLDSK